MSKQNNYSIIPPGSNQIAANIAGQAASTNTPFLCGGGGSVGSIGAGIPIYSSPSVNVGAGVFTNYGHKIPSNAGFGFGARFKF